MPDRIRGDNYRLVDLCKLVGCDVDDDIAMLDPRMGMVAFLAKHIIEGA